MDKRNALIQEVCQKYGEWLEMAGDQAPAMIIDILAKMIIEERQVNEYYRRRLNNVSTCSTNR